MNGEIESAGRRPPRLPGGFSLPPLGIHQVLALVIVAIALWAQGVLLLGIDTVRQWSGTWQDQLRFHVYVPQERADEASEFAGRLRAIDAVETVRIIPPEEGASWMASWLGGGSIPEAELARHLPTVLEIGVRGEATAFAFRDIRDEASRLGARVNGEEAGLADLSGLLARLERAVWFVSALMGAAMALIISNTLRMLLLARADEVHLMRLLGAEEWFVRLPFVLEGMLLGGAAALLAWLLLWPLVLGSAGWSARVGVELSALAPLAPMLISGIGVGALGALVATARSAASGELHR